MQSRPALTGFVGNNVMLEGALGFIKGDAGDDSDEDEKLTPGVPAQNSVSSSHSVPELRLRRRLPESASSGCSGHEAHELRCNQLVADRRDGY
jgi:hypothetical protein